MVEVIRVVPKSPSGSELDFFREARAIYDSLFPPSDSLCEQRDKASGNHLRIGADVHSGEGDLL
jgi:hypothetical protein